MTIERINSLGYVAWIVVLDDIELARFTRYTHAVDFVLFMDSI